MVPLLCFIGVKVKSLFSPKGNNPSLISPVIPLQGTEGGQNPFFSPSHSPEGERGEDWGLRGGGPNPRGNSCYNVCPTIEINGHLDIQQ